MKVPTADSEAIVSPGEPLGWRQQPWIWPHLLSLDAPAVAILWQLLFAKALHARLAPIVTAVMALVIWLIYVADRILDSYQPEEEAREPLRHQFYRMHRKAFLAPFFAVLLVTCWMAYAKLGLRMRRDGLLLAFIVAAYFLIVHALGDKAHGWFPKELAVAVLFGAGTFMPVGLRAPQLHFSFLFPFLLFIFVLWMNTLLIEYAEWIAFREGQGERPHVSTVLAGKHLAVFGLCTGVLALFAMAIHALTLTRPILLAEALSALALGALGLYWRKISFRAVGIAADTALLTPILLLLSRR